jgi:hypothetical protein
MSLPVDLTGKLTGNPQAVNLPGSVMLLYGEKTA